MNPAYFFVSIFCGKTTCKNTVARKGDCPLKNKKCRCRSAAPTFFFKIHDYSGIVIVIFIQPGMLNF